MRALRTILVLTLLSLGLAEAALRFYGAQLLGHNVPLYYYREYFVKLFDYDSRVIFTRKPGTEVQITNSAGEKILYKINSLGLRDVERTIPATSSPILALGDSFTFGVGAALDHMFQRKLEAATNIEVWNLGSLAFGSDQELLLWREWKEKVRPRALLLQICVNDLSDVMNHVWLGENGALIAGAEGVPTRVQDRQWKGGFWDYFELAMAVRYLFALGQRAHPSDADFTAAVARMSLIFSEFRKDTERAGIPFIILQASGWGEEVYGKKWADSYERAVTEAAGKRAIWVRAPEFIQAKDLLPFPDLHWNKTGHDKVANRLVLEIRKIKN